MPAAPPGPLPPVTSIAEAITRMELIDTTAPPSDGVACFNRMYLEVTQEVDKDLGQQFFADPAFMTRFDVTFANLYFDAVDAAAGQSADAAAGQSADTDAGESAVPLAWRPLFERRGETGIEPIQFALAGMNAHINHDLPLAVVATCTDLATVPTAGTHLADYQKVDGLLDAAEQSVRQSFESAPELAIDRHLRAVENLVCGWTINTARDLAWGNALLLWELRDDPLVRGLFLDNLAASAALASRLLLVAGCGYVPGAATCQERLRARSGKLHLNDGSPARGLRHRDRRSTVLSPLGAQEAEQPALVGGGAESGRVVHSGKFSRPERDLGTGAGIGVAERDHMHGMLLR
jgi:Family of unknown function (DUF5995)